MLYYFLMLYNRFMNNKKSISAIDKVSYALLVVALGIFVVAQGLIHNPDQDCYFLIDNGRYIVQNRALPETAYWLINEGVPTVIQQWMCDVVNYFAYAMGGYTGIVILGIIFNLTLLGALFLYNRDLLKSNQTGLNAAIFVWILLGQYASTRPYSITISLNLIELIVLKHFFDKEKHTAKETAKFLAIIAAIFVFQANWQASNIPYPMFWILCYIPVFKKKKFRIDLYALAALVTGGVFSILSPIGIRGPLFLTYSIGSFDGFEIYEIQPPEFPSLYTVLQVTLVALFIYAIVKRKLTSPQFFLAAGCFFMSCLFMRCCWTLVLPIGALLPNLEFTERSHKMMRWAYVAAGALSVFLIVRYNLEKTNDRAIMLASIPPPDQVTLYTDFNSGSYFLVDGYKIYYDARPELYDKRIAGDKAFLDEARDSWSGQIDYGEFIERYGFDWFAVTAGSPMQDYLENNSDYELVCANYTDQLILFRKTAD